MTLIQGYQINLNSISGFIQSVATGTGVSNNYYPAGSNPSGYLPSGNLIAGSNITITQSGQNLVVSSPLNGVNSYFGYTGFSVNGNSDYTGNLASNQGMLTTRVNLLNGIYTTNFVVGSGNMFAGAIARFNFQFASGTGINLNISGYNSSLNINQPGFSAAATVYFEFSNDGTKWNIDQWV